MAITKQDFGTKARRWEAWWEKHKDDDRVEWLFEGPRPQGAARSGRPSEEELRELTGEYFGYHFDLPRARARAGARRAGRPGGTSRPRRNKTYAPSG